MRLSIYIFLVGLCSILCCADGRDGIKLDNAADNNAADNNAADNNAADNRVRLSNNGGEMILDRESVESAWIRVPWSNGGYYYHNTLTGEDSDEVPNCADKNCKWS